jgi:hypothetical protein
LRTFPDSQPVTGAIVRKWGDTDLLPLLQGRVLWPQTPNAERSANRI